MIFEYNNEPASLMEIGSWFHCRGPITEKALSPVEYYMMQNMIVSHILILTLNWGHNLNFTHPWPVPQKNTNKVKYSEKFIAGILVTWFGKLKGGVYCRGGVYWSKYSIDISINQSINQSTDDISQNLHIKIHSKTSRNFEALKGVEI